MKENSLLVEREGKESVFEVEEAAWNICSDSDDGRSYLCVYADGALGDDSDPEVFTWELNLFISKRTGALKKGFKAILPSGYDESKEGWMTNFCYQDEQFGTDNNSIEIIDVQDDKLRIRLKGGIDDIHAALSLDAWFEKDEDVERTVC